LIFDFIGTPTQDDYSFVTDDKAVLYLRQFKPRPQANLRQVYRTGSDDALRLISSMLQFNPYFRPTVDELLSDNYFSDVR